MVGLYIKYYKLNGDFYKNMLSALEVTREKAMAERAGKFYVRYALDEKRIIMDGKATTKEECINTLIDTFVGHPAVVANIETLRNAVFAREAQAPTGIADGIALPHAKCAGVKSCQLAFMKVPDGVDFGAPDGKKCDLIFLLISPDDGESHLNMIGRLGIILNEEKVRSALRNCNDPYTFIEILQKEEKELIKTPA